MTLRPSPTGKPSAGASAATSPGLGHAGEMVIRVAGGVLVAWLAVLSAVVEAFLVPLRVAGVQLPVALLLAAVGNLGLPYLALWLVRHRAAATLPALLWFVVILIFAGGTSEGDVVLAGDDWVALTLLLLGSAAAAGGVYLALLRTPSHLLRVSVPLHGDPRRGVP